MQLDYELAIVGLVVGFVVGITGMGGGALMTPILVILFKVQPLAAVSSDLVASFFMKPLGAAVHYRRGTVHRELVLWLMVGSVPSAFAGVVLLRLLGHGHEIQQVVQTALGVALILAAAAIVVKAVLQLRTPVHGAGVDAGHAGEPVRRLPTILVGVVGGLVVGMTSVGSGSLMIVALMLLYPRLTAARLVGTDLTQAIPLVGSAAIGHVLFGDFRLSLTVSLLLGAIPGVYLGARASAQAPSGIVKRAIAFVLLASGLKLINIGTVQLGVLLLAVAIAGEPVWALIRRTSSRPAPPVVVPEA
ncbi:MAG TPA: sulfite exporter TauE/SafE family protein [Candidatus Dormibacteraeota bacterium]